ncbi:MAG: efflux RND transporter permease subunit [Proteobacteria bacterium]|nr:efflux RND transporter permease subunit [Pseudomonadota bacterium]
MTSPTPNIFDSLVRKALQGGLPLLVFFLAVVFGGLAIQFTAREEEPQIVVPMVDVLVQAPSLSAEQVERQVTIPMERLLSQIPGVEHIYSVSNAGQSAVTLRFYVGEDREESILNTYTKIHSNWDEMPAGVDNWVIKPVEVDDVPILLLGLWSDDAALYSDFELRRLAEELATVLQAVPNTSEVDVVGGRPRAARVLLDTGALASRRTTAMDIVSALQASNVLMSAGEMTFGNKTIVLESGDVLRDAAELKTLVVNVVNGVPVYLQDVAEIVDGPTEPRHYTWLEQGAGNFPMVTISVAKQRGSNAVKVSQEVQAEFTRLQDVLLPPEVHVDILRDYGDTADEKVTNLASSLLFAVFTVVIFISVFLGWRPALVVGLAVPICYGITLALDFAFGYTINRVTLFALILSLGLLVDDPITGVDNIERFLRDKTLKAKSINDRIVAAIAEIRVPLLMSTVTIILAFLPLAYISGMMGPYMAPMAFNVPVSVMTSTVVAFIVTPWLASKVLLMRHGGDDIPEGEDSAEPQLPEHSGLVLLYQRLLAFVLDSRSRSKLLLWLVLLLFVLAAMLPVLRLVPLKLLPGDNRNEIQIVIDMPEGSSLEETNAMALQVSQRLHRLPEVKTVAGFIGIPSPMDFNGMVRRYYQRYGSNMADLRVTLIDKNDREHQSHAVVLRLRELFTDLNAGEISIKAVEVPPGPPVMSTLVAEVYGDTMTPYELQYEAARKLMQRLEREPHVVEIDSSIEALQQRLRFVVNKKKAALSGVATSDISELLALSNDGLVATYIQAESEAEPMAIELRLPLANRAGTTDFEQIYVRGRPGIVLTTTDAGVESAPQPLVAMGELGEFVELTIDRAIHRKDLRRVVYVTAELSGRTPAEAIADIYADSGNPGLAPEHNPDAVDLDWEGRTYLNSGGNDSWSVPAGTEIVWTGEGEWGITISVFRDMGLAFAFALVAIYFVLYAQTASASLSLIIMSAIPLTIIGIMPGFWLLNQFGERAIGSAPVPVLFTATAMIGMIALAGIVVRNSLILVEFISQSRAAGLNIREAVLRAGAVRMRPVLLTAGTTMLGNLVIVLDPVFSGLAIAIMFGIVASTLFTLLVVPVVYLLVFEKSENPL